MVAFQPYRA